MPRFSSFNPFGHLRFSGRPAVGQNIYADAVRNLGGEDNVDTSIDSHVMAKVYADSMACARAYLTVTRAGLQYRPDRMGELLTANEATLGITPYVNETIADRQARVSAELKISRGARRSNIERVLRETIGNDLVSIRYTTRATSVLAPANREDSGVFAKPGTEKQIFELTQSVLFTGTPVTVTYKSLVSSTGSLKSGEKVHVELNSHSRREVITVTSVAPGTLTATFSYPHQVGTKLVTGRTVTAVNSIRHTAFILKPAAVLNKKILAKLNRALRKLVRGVSTWSVTDDSGPFRVGVGRIGVTTIGDVTP